MAMIIVVVGVYFYKCYILTVMVCDDYLIHSCFSTYRLHAHIYRNQNYKIIVYINHKCASSVNDNASLSS